MLENYRQNKALVFLAEDDEDDASFVRMALTELDKEIILDHFPDGKQLIRRLKDDLPAQRPSFILLDLNMPVLDGRETLKLIRQEISSDLPVIILSTSNKPEEKKECILNGANFYYTKPYSYHAYLDIMKDLKCTWLDKVHA